MKVALIDADSIAYICSKDSLEESLTRVDSIVGEMMLETGSTEYLMFLSKSPYFRHQICKEYKAKRPPKTLLFIKDIYKYLEEVFGAKAFDGVEADDMVAFGANMYRKANIPFVVCSNDKDVTKQVPGEHFNYRTFNKCTTKDTDALSFLFIQTLMGDSTDNIKGIPGIGEVKAKKILEGKDTMPELSSATMEAYANYYSKAGEAVEEYQKNFKQVYLLRQESDFLREVGYVPKLDEPREFIEKK